MDCPKCKTPNPTGSEYCGMCYEPFNHSAAKSYLWAMRREKMQAERDARASSSSTGKAFQEGLASASALINDHIDVSGIKQAASNFYTRYKKYILLTAGGFCLGLLIMAAIQTISSIQPYRFFYEYEDKTATVYLIGFKAKVKMYSEREGRLDTPMQDLEYDELGNLHVKREVLGKAKDQKLLIKVAEWIQMVKVDGALRSKPIPANHPSLKAASIVLDRKGYVKARQYEPTTRTAKATEFVLPTLPKSGLKRNRQWTQNVAWTEMIGDWKIHWKGQFAWTLQGDVEGVDNPRTRLSYVATLVPKIWGTPQWAKNASGKLMYKVQGTGEALYDRKTHHLLSNRFQYEGLLRLPINDLGAIPSDLRVGRPVRGIPGDILFQFQNFVDIREN